jgi:hypothetical protein
MTPGAAKGRGAPLEAPLAARRAPPPADAADATRGSYRFPKGGRENVLRGLLPSGERRAGRWDGGGCGWLWQWSRWSVSLWEREPCS